MKLERLTEYVTVVVTIVIGIFLAFYIGSSAGSGSSTPALIIGGMLAVMMALILQSNVWLLIPLCAPFIGRLAGTPAGLSVCHLAVLYAFVVFFALKALKVVRIKSKYNWLDYLLFINLAYLLVTYIRNPVGTDSLGFGKIGGKPYFEVVIAFLAYWVINHVELSPKLAMKMPLIMIFGAVVNGVLGVIIGLFPSVGLMIGHVYNGFTIKDINTVNSTDDVSIDRDLNSKSFGVVLMVLCSYYSPLSLLKPLPTLNPFSAWRFLIAAFCFIATLRSGFRSIFISVGLFFIISTYFRDGIRHVFRIPLILVPVLVLLIGIQGNLVQLPLNIQRSLSFLPGDWDRAVKVDAQRSTEWRIEIWKNVWNSGNRYIKDWWWGDGFGMTKTELREAQQALGEDQENLIISGDYHNLALSTIHIVGYVGFVLSLILMFGMAYYAWKLILMAKGTPYFPMALFVGVPVFYSPLTGLFIFGAFKTTVFANIYCIAWMRLIARALEKYFEERNAVVEKKDVVKDKSLPSLLGSDFA